MTTQREKALDLARDGGTIRAEDVRDAGLHTQVLTRLVREGSLERIGPGLYRLSEAPRTRHHNLAVVSGVTTDAVVCLLSALSFHDIGTQLPSRVWIAVRRGTRPPAIDWPPVRVFTFSAETFEAGVERHEIEGQEVRVYTVAKTVADLFKYRNKVGMDVVLEALREVWEERRATVDELTHFARLCRVDRVMRPYLQAIVS